MPRVWCRQVSQQRSQAIDAVLAVHGTPDPWAARASDHPCQGAKFHSPSPLVTHMHDELDVWLCPTCKANLDCFVYLAEREPMEWPVLREFGNRIRALGQQLLSLRKVRHA